MLAVINSCNHTRPSDIVIELTVTSALQVDLQLDLKDLRLDL